jgi:hypothetical protein
VTQARTDGLILLILGSLVFVAFGCVLESTTPKSMNDFKAPYYGAKCLLEHCDPYNRDNLTRQYLPEEGERARIRSFTAPLRPRMSTRLRV